jgi:hypothetical protein
VISTSTHSALLNFGKREDACGEFNDAMTLRAT